LSSRKIAQLKADLLARATLNELTQEEKELNAKLAKGVEDIPVKRMMDQILYIRNELLPGIERKRGKSSPDYEFFAGVADSLIYAIIMADRFGGIEAQNTRLRIYSQLQRDHVELLERELQKFTTLEDLFYSSALDRYADMVKSRVDNLLKDKK
jgi:hypothetical protein